MSHKLILARKLARDLSRQAEEARALAATFSDDQTVKDLENFAQRLEEEAHGLGDDCGVAKSAAR